jgi:hypothetical protein
MKIKKILITFTIIFASICLFSFSNKANAATISNDGKYSLVLTANEMDGCFDGEYVKLVRFNIAEGETTVKLSELTKGIIPFNGKTEFSHWEMAENTKASEELEIANFTGSGNFYTSTGKEVNYTNALTLSAKFSDKELKDSGKYYVSIDAFGGTINGKAKLTLKSKSAEFKTIDLTKYTPVRKGYTFKGWDLDGKIVTSVNSSAFAKDAVINLTATYTQDTFAGDDRVLILNANGGTIDGKASNKYDYLGGGNSGTAMSLLPYTPVRAGYKFVGWNTKKDGSGKKYTYIYWRVWDKDRDTDFEKDTIIKNALGAEYYQNVTLYASWTKIGGEEETVKKVESSSKTKGSIEFEEDVDKNYRLEIQKVEIKQELANKDVKFVADINLLYGNEIIKIDNKKMKIKIALPDELKGYNKYEVVYILNNKIKETIPATVENGYIVFETTHLSEYGIIAKNVEQENNTESTDTANDDEQKENTNSTNNISKTETSNPKTGDNIITNIILFVGAIIAIVSLAIVNKNRKRK